MPSTFRFCSRGHPNKQKDVLEIERVTDSQENTIETSINKLI